jgi:hypothetical protein
MCQYKGAISGETFIAIKIILNGHTYKYFICWMKPYK